MLKLIVFDCDGVMFDSKKATCKYYNHLLQHFGLPPMTESEQDFVHMSSVTDSTAHIFRHYKKPTLEEVNAMRAQFTYTPFLKYMEMEEDLIEFLQRITPKYHRAISTNRTDTMVPLLKKFNLEKYFEKVVTANSAKKPKPAPDGLLEILDHFSCRPEETVFIGDSIVDEQHAAACDVPLIAFKNPQLNARYHVNSFLQILRLPGFNG